jgi:hypothetical protein
VKELTGLKIGDLLNGIESPDTQGGEEIPPPSANDSSAIPTALLKRIDENTSVLPKILRALGEKGLADKPLSRQRREGKVGLPSVADARRGRAVAGGSPVSPALARNTPSSTTAPGTLPVPAIAPMPAPAQEPLRPTRRPTTISTEAAAVRRKNGPVAAEATGVRVPTAGGPRTPKVQVEPDGQESGGRDSGGRFTKKSAGQEAKEKGDDKREKKGVWDLLKKGLSSATGGDGNGGGGGPETAQDAAGAAVGGPIWSAVKEIKDAAGEYKGALAEDTRAGKALRKTGQLFTRLKFWGKKDKKEAKHLDKIEATKEKLTKKRHAEVLAALGSVGSSAAEGGGDGGGVISSVISGVVGLKMAKGLLVKGGLKGLAKQAFAKGGLKTIAKAVVSKGGLKTLGTMAATGAAAKLATSGPAVKLATKVATAGGTKIAAEVAAKGGAKVAAEVATKTAGKTAAKAAGKTGAKTLLKKIPGIGAVIGAGFAVKRLLDGDALGAAGELLSGVASIVPGFGTAASFAIDGALAVRDYNQATAEAVGTEQEAAETAVKQKEGADKYLPPPQQAQAVSMAQSINETSRNSFITPLSQPVGTVALSAKPAPAMVQPKAAPPVKVQVEMPEPKAHTNDEHRGKGSDIANMQQVIPLEFDSTVLTLMAYDRV